MVLAFLYAAETLLTYFQVHVIKLVTEYPLKPALDHTGKSGGLQKSSILVTKFNQKHEPRIPKKGQALADFLVDFPIEHPNPTLKCIPKLDEEVK